MKPQIIMSNNLGSTLPRFLTFEGGEGAGKTTLIRKLEKVFHSWRLPFLSTREPGGTAFGEQIREWLLKHPEQIPLKAKAELLLFLAGRIQHIEEKIAPAIQKGILVLCDRFNDSTIAYQGAGRALGVAWVRTLCEMTCEDIRPDLTIYLDLDPKIGLKRRQRAIKENATQATHQRRQMDRIESESLDFHQRVRAAFHDIANEEPERFYLIDANQPIENVFKATMKVIANRFAKD